MSSNYTVCDICGAKIQMGDVGAARMDTFYSYSPIWHETRHFCVDCTKKLSGIVDNESRKLRKKKSRQAKWRRTKQRIMSVKGGTK